MKSVVFWEKDFNQKQALVNRALKRYLPKGRMLPQVAIRYSSLAPAKRFRPVLVLSTTEVCGGNLRRAIPAACAIEMIHTYSLIHDDLPAMDNDDYRRGLPTCHRRFGEAAAILTGDALSALAYEVVGKTDLRSLPQETFPHLVRILSVAIYQMICGQVMDLAAEGKKISLASLRRLYAYKTGALIRCSVQFGALLGAVFPGTKRWQALTKFANHLGLAFQIVDDILDETSDLKRMGKTPGRDRDRNKATYPALMGIERAYHIAWQEGNKAKNTLLALGKETERLAYLVDLAIQRER